MKTLAKEIIVKPNTTQNEDTSKRANSKETIVEPNTARNETTGERDKCGA
ncbi:19040_t:CDS:2 [Gigaspora margarita]|uniref:19040_t:CDS:1 n=1 Tax=Gigaspora margarita TaxID=4874 RepID=A0ABN7UZ53_GIGMA|nr:19040_t:CDS:2 [Gigaspora margarita]